MIYHGDLFDVLPTLEAESIDACVTDPPYELNFMSKSWDRSGVAFRKETWAEVWRVLKPGAHLVAFGGTRNFHRMTCAIEDAGFEIRDCLSWLYGQGFPKSLDIGKALDKQGGRIGQSILEIKRKLQNAVSENRLTLAQFNTVCGFEASGYLRESSTWATVLPSFDKWIVIRDTLHLSADLDDLFREAEREVIGSRRVHRGVAFTSDGPDALAVSLPATDAAKQWHGWGTALKPSWEPIILARKPFKGSVAANVQQHGTGALNIDACRIEGTGDGGSWGDGRRPGGFVNIGASCGDSQPNGARHDLGRWPANVVIDEEAARLLDEQSGELTSGSHDPYIQQHPGWKNSSIINTFTNVGDSGGASRFFLVVRGGDECQSLNGVSDAEQSSEPNGSGGGSVASHAQASLMGLWESTGNGETSGEKAPSTNATRSALSGHGKSDTPPIPSSGGESSRESGDANPTQNRSRANYVGALAPTDTTTTTTDQMTSDGSADDATSIITSINTGHGAKASDDDSVRFRYCAKPSRAERDEGIYDLMPASGGEATDREDGSAGLNSPRAGAGRNGGARNIHPTVKPVELMRWLVRLITPVEGVVLDPFMGSGTTGIACKFERRHFLGVERDATYLVIAERRMMAALPLFDDTVSTRATITRKPETGNLFEEDEVRPDRLNREVGDLVFPTEPD